MISSRVPAVWIMCDILIIGVEFNCVFRYFLGGDSGKKRKYEDSVGVDVLSRGFAGAEIRYILKSADPGVHVSCK